MTSVSVNVPSSVTMVNVPSSFFVTVRVWILARARMSTVAESPFGSWSMSVISGVS